MNIVYGIINVLVVLVVVGGGCFAAGWLWDDFTR